MMMSYSIVYADSKKDLFDDYGIYSKEIDKRIVTVKKEVYTEIDKIKKLLIDDEIETVNEKLKNIKNRKYEACSYISSI